MIKNLKFIFFSSAIVLLSFLLMAMDMPSPAGAVVPFQSGVKIYNIHDIPYLKKNRWVLYHDNNGIVVDIDLLVNCEGDSQEAIDEKNSSFAESLACRIQNGEITSFGMADVAARAIPCDIPDALLLLFGDILQWAKWSKEAIGKNADLHLLMSVNQRLGDLSCDQEVKCINLFNDLGVSATGFLRGRNSVFNLKEGFLIDKIVKRTNEDIGAFLKISELAFYDVELGKLNHLSASQIEEMFDKQLEESQSLGKELKNLNTMDAKEIMQRITFKSGEGFFSEVAKTPEDFFDNEISWVNMLEKSKKINSTYAISLKNTLKEYKKEGKEILLSKNLSDLMLLIEDYAGHMIAERIIRDADPTLWQVEPSVEGSQEITMPETSEPSMAPQSEPVISMASQKGMTLKQKILAMLAAGGVVGAAYLLYQYLTQKQ